LQRITPLWPLAGGADASAVSGLTKLASGKRKDWPEEQTKLPRMPVAAHPAPQPSLPPRKLFQEANAFLSYDEAQQ